MSLLYGEGNNSGLVAEWSFSSLPGDGIISDQSGNGNSTILNGGTIISGGSGKALYFDGIDDCLICQNKNVPPDSSFTVMSWLYPESLEGTQALFSKGSWNQNGEGFNIFLSDGYICAHLYDSKKNKLFLKSSGKMKLREWQHIALTFDGGKICLYSGGEKCAEKNIEGFSSLDRNMVTGRWCYGDCMWLHGAMDGIRFYEKALTGPEIKEIRDREKEKLISNVLKLPTDARFKNTETIDVSGNWKMKCLDNVIEARSFTLQGNSELKKDSSAWDEQAATPGGSSNCSVFSTWKHLNLQKGAMYNIYIHYKTLQKNAGGGALSGWTNVFSFRNEAPDWADLKIGPFDPFKKDNVVFYGSSALSIDRITFAKDGEAPEYIDTSWMTQDSRDEGFKNVVVPATWKDKKVFKNASIVLLKKNLEIPAHYKQRNGYFIFRTGDMFQAGTTYFNGVPLIELDRNIYGILHSSVNWEKENCLAVKISAVSPEKKAAANGPFELLFVPSPQVPAWTKAATVERMPIAPDIEIVSSIEKETARENLLKVRFGILKDGVPNPCFNVRLTLNGENIPLHNNWSTGEYVTWISCLDEGVNILSLKLDLPDGTQSEAILLKKDMGHRRIAFKENPFIVGAWLPHRSVGKAEASAYYGKLFSLLNEAGINTAILLTKMNDRSNWDVIKRLSLEHKIYLIVYPFYPPKRLNPVTFYDEMACAVNEFKDCPNLLAYGLMDEISMNDIPKWNYLRMLVNGLDPSHPLTVVLNQNSREQVDRLKSNIIHRDIYYDLPLFSKEVATASSFTRESGKELWVTVAAGFPPARLRTMCWDSLLEGAGGVFFFQAYTIYPEACKWQGFIKLPGLTLLNQSETIKETAGKMRILFPILRTLHDAEDVSKTDDGRICIKTKQDAEKGFYLFLENTDLESTVSATLTIDRSKAGTVSGLTDVLRNERVTTDGENSFRFTISPGDLHVYKLITE